MKAFKLVAVMGVAMMSAVVFHAHAGGGVHGHGHGGEEAHHESHPEGPRGGRLLEDGDFAIEVTIFETGVPPEMRLYAYHDGAPVSPDEVQAMVTLDRLGGDADYLRFSSEQDYLLGSVVVTEPHSFDVTIKAQFGDKRYEWQYESHEGRTDIPERLLQTAGVKTEVAGTETMDFSVTLFGVIAPPADKVLRVQAPYAGQVEAVYVNVGDSVEVGQRLLTLTNTQTLQRYDIKSVQKGEVTQRWVNIGDLASDNVLLEISNLSQVWVEMSAFPESIEQLALGQKVVVRDLHHHLAETGEIRYVAPVMTGGHIARTRAVINNSDGHWRPGMHIKAEVFTGSKQVPLAVKTAALQQFREMPVVFARFGNTFEVRMLELGESNGEYIEVLGGLKPGTEYVTGNSFLIKADVLKDGATHSH